MIPKKEFLQALEGSNDNYIELEGKPYVYECSCRSNQIEKELTSMNVVQFPKITEMELEAGLVELEPVVINKGSKFVTGRIGRCNLCGTYYYFKYKKS